MRNYNELEGMQPLMAVHVCVRLAISQIGPHQTAVCSSKTAKGENVCETLGNAQKPEWKGKRLSLCSEVENSPEKLTKLTTKHCWNRARPRSSPPP
jgi:hypothetical protein